MPPSTLRRYRLSGEHGVDQALGQAQNHQADRRPHRGGRRSKPVCTGAGRSTRRPAGSGSGNRTGSGDRTGSGNRTARATVWLLQPLGHRRGVWEPRSSGSSGHAPGRELTLELTHVGGGAGAAPDRTICATCVGGMDGMDGWAAGADRRAWPPCSVGTGLGRAT